MFPNQTVAQKHDEKKCWWTVIPNKEHWDFSGTFRTSRWAAVNLLQYKNKKKKAENKTDSKGETWTCTVDASACTKTQTDKTPQV